jgi:hypothetical protein
MDLERRRDARFFTSFWLSIAEVADATELLKGNISVSGVFFRTDKDVGRPGTVRLLRIATADRRASVEVMAHVVRVISYDDLLQGRVIGGAAFEFLLGTAHQRNQVEQFVHEVAEDHLHDPGSLPLDYSFPAQVHDASDDRQPATVSELSLGGMVIETGWPVKPGEAIRAEIHTSGSQKSVHLAGRAVASQRADGEGERYRVAVRFGDGRQKGSPPGENPGSSVAEAMDSLLEEVTSWRRREMRSQGIHLHGKLSQVPLPSLLGFLDIERTSGVIELERGSQHAKLFVRQAEIVGLEMRPPGASPSKVLADLMDWRDGEFSIRFEPVGREDTVGISIPALLMHLAKRKDESSARG